MDTTPVTSFEWIQIGQSLVMVLAMLFAWSLRTGIKSGRWLSAGDAQSERVKAIENRMDRASTALSEIASDVQKLPDRWREEGDRRYMSHEMSEERWAENRRVVATLTERVRLLELDGARLVLSERVRQLELAAARGNPQP